MLIKLIIFRGFLTLKLRFWAVFKPEMTLSLLHIVHNTSKYTFLPQSPKLPTDQMSSLLPVCKVPLVLLKVPQLILYFTMMLRTCVLQLLSWFCILPSRGWVKKQFTNVLLHTAKIIDPRVKSQARGQNNRSRALKWDIVHLCNLNGFRDMIKNKIRNFLEFSQFLQFSIVFFTIF